MTSTTLPPGATSEDAAWEAQTVLVRTWEDLTSAWMLLGCFSVLALLWMWLYFLISGAPWCPLCEPPTRGLFSGITALGIGSGSAGMYMFDQLRKVCVKYRRRPRHWPVAAGGCLAAVVLGVLTLLLFL